MTKTLKLTVAIFCLCSTAFMYNTMAQTQISIEEYFEQDEVKQTAIHECFSSKDYKKGEKLLYEAIASFNQLSKEDQENYKRVQAGNYYNLACIYSLQNQKKKAVNVFEIAVNVYGYPDYSHAKQDTDLDNIRTDKRFIALMESIREKGDMLYILQQSGKYQQTDTIGLPQFTYEKATSSNLKNVRDFFKLDSIAGQGNEISKIFNLMTWVQSNIRHNGNNFALCEFTSIDLYNYHKSTDKGINCRHLAIMLNEMYLAMGFKSRYVTCMPKDSTDKDCHVINAVYSDSLKKWLWIDPSFNAYIKDENGNLLSIEEVRERLIDGRPLVLNEDANWNKEKKTKEWYLDYYMAKNLYWFNCIVNSQFNAESRYRWTGETYVSLCPVGFTPSKQHSTKVITNDNTYFWNVNF